MTQIDEQIRTIKRQFRQAMNGVVATSMREKGFVYKVNFGLTLPLIKRIATSYPADASLAMRLWAEPVRESKMLATWLYPPQEMDETTARQWVKETPYPEIADLCCMNLFTHIESAPNLALYCISSNESDLTTYTGYRLMQRLLAQGYRFSADEIDQILSSTPLLLEKNPTMHTLVAAGEALKQLAKKQPDIIAMLEKTLSSCHVEENINPFINDILEECQYLKNQDFQQI